MKEQLKGIALVLFGILLCCAEEGLNSIVLHSFGEIPFSLIGLLIGCVGLSFVFRSTQGLVQSNPLIILKAILFISRTKDFRFTESLKATEDLNFYNSCFE